jgi:peptidyl-prolyl cis-trans isomerase D
VAKAQSQDPGSAANGGDLDFFARGAMVKPFEDVVYALPKGGISDLVETEFGFHIIQLTDIKSPPQRSFEAMRPEIEAELRQQQAQRQFAEAAESFSNLVYEQADSLKPAAERLKLEIRTAQGVLRQPQANTTGVLANERLLAAIFAPDAIDQKRNTEAIETGSSQLVSARVVKHLPARTRPLDEVRESVRTRLVTQRAAELAREEGDKQLLAWKAGGSEAGLSAVQTVSRENSQGLPQSVLLAALSADPKNLPAWVGVPVGEEGYAVVKVEKVLPRQSREAQALQQEVQQYSQWWAAAEGLAYYETLKERFKARILVDEPTPAPVASR